MEKGGGTWAMAGTPLKVNTTHTHTHPCHAGDVLLHARVDPSVHLFRAAAGLYTSGYTLLHSVVFRLSCNAAFFSSFLG